MTNRTRGHTAARLAAEVWGCTADDVEVGSLGGPSAQAVVWRATRRGANHRPLVLKHHRRKGAAAREAVALRTIAARLPGHLAPRLRLDRSREGWLAMSWLPGATPTTDADLGVRGEAALGGTLARLHEGACPPDAVPLAEAWTRRLGGVVDVLGDADVIDGDELARWVRFVQARLIAWLERVAPKRCPCHRDVALRNLRQRDVAGTAVVGLVDFAHARCDLWMADLASWSGERWAGRPGREAAFWRGYGRRPDPAEARALTGVRAHYALATLAWTVRADDDPATRSEARVRARLGRAVLDRLAGELEVESR